MTTIEPRTAVVTIYQGDYLDQIRFVEAKYEAAVKAEKAQGSARLLSDESEAAKLAEEHATLIDRAEESALYVRVKALGRKAWRELLERHPSRPDNKDDAEAGVNVDTFGDALVAASIVEPALSEDDLDAISDADFQRLYHAAFRLNRIPATDPKALPVSPTNTPSDETSN